MHLILTIISQAIFPELARHSLFSEHWLSPFAPPPQWRSLTVKYAPHSNHHFPTLIDTSWNEQKMWLLQDSYKMACCPRAQPWILFGFPLPNIASYPPKFKLVRGPRGRSGVQSAFLIHFAQDILWHLGVYTPLEFSTKFPGPGPCEGWEWVQKSRRGPWAQGQELRVCQQALESDSMGSNFLEKSGEVGLWPREVWGEDAFDKL